MSEGQERGQSVCRKRTRLRGQMEWAPPWGRQEGAEQRTNDLVLFCQDNSMVESQVGLGENATVGGGGRGLACQVR